MTPRRQKWSDGEKAFIAVVILVGLIVGVIWTLGKIYHAFF